MEGGGSRNWKRGGMSLIANRSSIRSCLTDICQCSESKRIKVTYHSAEAAAPLGSYCYAPCEIPVATWAPTQDLMVNCSRSWSQDHGVVQQ